LRRVTALVALVAAGCARCTSPHFALRPAEPGPAQPPFPVKLRVLHFGDFGDDTIQQGKVARAMAAFSATAPVDLVLSVGDNVYECGPDVPAGPSACAFEPDGNTVSPGYSPPADEGFRKKFEAPLEEVRRDGQPVPTFLVLGNHDVNASGKCGEGKDPAAVARARACAEVAHRSPRWSMPGRHFALDRGPIRFIAIDSNLLKGDYGGFSFDDEVAFVARASEPCAEKLCFLVAHHPSASAGEHYPDGTPDYVARVKRIEAAAQGRIVAWLAGHEHQMEHLRSPAGYDVLISGNTARGRPQERFDHPTPGSRLLFASTIWGFGVLEVGDGRWAYRFVNDRGEPVQCCAASGRGPCEPVRCSAGAP